VIAGLAVALAAACGYELAYAVQVLEARGAGGAGADRSLLLRLVRRPRWVAGMGLSGLATALQVLALTLAPLTLVQPVLALGLVLLLGLAATVLGEAVGRWELAGVAAVVAGVAVVALTSSTVAEAAAPSTPGLLAVMAVLAAVALLPVVRRRGAGGAARVAAAAAGDAAAALALKGVATALDDGRPLVAVAWAAVALATGLLALHAEMSALQRVAATHVAPVVLAAQVLVPVAAAPLVLGEGWGATPAGGVVLGAGVVLVAAGAVLLGSSGALGDVLAVGRGGAEAAKAVEDRVGG
jgi:drug/metabolite transporter (DMT)-like permease